MFSQMMKFRPMCAMPMRRFAAAIDGVPRMSVVRHPYSLDDQPIDAAAAAAKRFAVVEFSGRQYKIAENDVIVADYIRDTEIGADIALDKVLLVGSKTETMMGHPYLEGAVVHTSVEEITEADKVMIFKHRRRKNSKRLRGFRRDVVTLRINKIAFAEDLIIDSSRVSTGPKN